MYPPNRIKKASCPPRDGFSIMSIKLSDRMHVAMSWKRDAPVHPLSREKPPHTFWQCQPHMGTSKCPRSTFPKYLSTIDSIAPRPALLSESGGPVSSTAGRNFSGYPLGVATRSTVGPLLDGDNDSVASRGIAIAEASLWVSEASCKDSVAPCKGERPERKSGIV